jgi:hypothetical protein
MASGKSFVIQIKHVLVVKKDLDPAKFRDDAEGIRLSLDAERGMRHADA